MLSTLKYKIKCTPTFCEGAFIAKTASCTMCQIKKNSVIDGPPPFVLKCAPPVWNQCKFLECYAMGATLGCGVTLAVFWYRGGTSKYAQITGPRASAKIDNKYEHHHNSNEFTSFLPVAPMLTTPTSSHNTPSPRECGGATRTCRADFFSQKLSPRCRILIPAIRPWQWLVRCRSFLSYDTFHSSMSLEHCGHVEVAWCSKKVSTLNKSWSLFVLN